MNDRNQMILIAAAGVVVILAGSVLLTEREPRSPSVRAATSTGLEAGVPAEAEPRAAEPGRTDQRIAALEAEVRRLNERIDRLSREHDEPSRRPVEEEASAPPPPPPRFSSIFEATAQRLRELVPDRFADLTAEELAMLTELDLRGVEITGEDLGLLAELTHLRRLSLRGTAITDAGLAFLPQGLESLDLRGTSVTGAGLRLLRGGELEALSLTHTAVRSEELGLLPPMPRLVTLKLNSIALDEAAIETIAAYRSVRHLELDSTGLTDQGLRRLLLLNPELTRIELRDTAVSPEVLEELRAAYPGCELVTGSGGPYGLPGDTPR